ncbi:long-chain fatty acid--CoA ligase [Denitratisoma sp. DHT3]|uniref:AMP-binding protein n=1 Tax=Denitratisoma sp. DHT3 TaxID=1981880 RepID=UPI0011989D00|nr:AMP-binding protein [Denitratisoma sp. DHT3]QDX80606.1 long-chain fatty acid--CoA ligase [Denitratisoma sp. DHT3]
MSTRRTYNLADLFDIVAEAVPDREAVVIGDKRISYRQLAERIDRLAVWLHGQGIGAGDTVGLQLYNTEEYLEAFMAACKVKAMPVNINYRYVAEELRYIYDNARLKALFYSPELEAGVQEALDAAPDLKAIVRQGIGQPAIARAVAYDAALAAAQGSVADIARSDDDISLLYTGGTTGMPKGVMWPHKALFFSALGGGGAFNPAAGPVKAPEELAERAQQGFAMRVMPVAPLMHGAALWATLISLFSGHTIVLNEQHHFDAEHILDLMTREKIGSISIVGDAMAMPILEALRASPGRWDLSSMFAFGSGGALFSAHIKEALKEFLPPHAIFTDGVGSSEGGQFGLGSKPSGDGMIKLAPRPDLTVVVDAVRLAKPGEMGILSRAGLVPVGYFGDPRKSAETFVAIDGVRYAITGDQARLEEDGSIVVFGRGSNCINTGGEKVFVEEVEEALRRHAAVADALVVGLPDPRWGSKVVAVVALKPGTSTSPDELRAHSREHLAGYKVPKEVVFVDAMRRSPSGKADYRWAKSAAETALNA